MKYIINGDTFEHSSTCIEDILTNWGATHPFAVAVNKHFVPKHLLKNTHVQSGDEIDIVSPIQGG